MESLKGLAMEGSSVIYIKDIEFISMYIFTQENKLLRKEFFK